MTVPPSRVLFFIGSLHAGGAERQVVELLKHLDRSRFAPVLALAVRDGALLAEVPADVSVHAFQEAHRGIPWWHRGGLGRIARWRWLSRLLVEQSINVVYDRTYLATLDTAGPTWRNRIPRLSAAVADPRVQLEMYARRPRQLWRRFSRWAYHSATLVLANSEGLRQQLVEFWQLPSDRVRVQPNGLDWERIDCSLTAEAPRPPNDRFRILTVGRIDADKGHADLLAAMANLVHQHGWHDALWQIVGTGPRQATLQAEVQRLRLTEQVEFIGGVANPFPYYRDADLFCLPSHTEGLPNVILEALGCGTPVLATDCPSGPRELLADGAYGRLTPVSDVPALTEALRACRRDGLAGKERAALGRTVIRERYDIRRTVRDLESLLLEAIASGAR